DDSHLPARLDPTRETEPRRRAGSLRPLNPVAKPARPAVRAAPAARSDVPPPFGPLAQASRSLRSLGLGRAARRPHQRRRPPLPLPPTPPTRNPRPAPHPRPDLRLGIPFLIVPLDRK